jgi:lipopolysaccharide transport system ATP-binding protein
MQAAIRVNELSKQYRLGGGARTSANLTEQVLGGARRWLNSLRGKSEHGADADFWALRDVSFAVAPGEAVGIIGRNGAGKSTLLKVLSRIVSPTGGRVEIRGRVGSLLEVGTGFHPELTGRENVYLNGSLLGMSRREITRKFDEIVGFSEVEQFLDTPVKRYSSGMYVRLAFAVAAHLEPEVLIVDEVLAVGDAVFQRRCMDRMSELVRSGRTILFVSHNMQLIPQLCHRAVLLERGRVARVGKASEVTRAYLEGMLAESRGGDLGDKFRTGDGRARFTRAELVDDSGQSIAQFECGDDLTVRMEIESKTDIPNANMAVVIATPHGTRIITSLTRESGFPVTIHAGRQTVICRFRKVMLRPGHSVLLHLWLSDADVIDLVENALVVDVSTGGRYSHLSTEKYQGIVVCDYDWRMGDGGSQGCEQGSPMSVRTE